MKTLHKFPPNVRFLTFFLFAFFCNYLHSQSAFFTEYQPNQIQMTFEQEARYDALQDTEVSKSVKIVSTADVPLIKTKITPFLQLNSQATRH